MRSPTEVPTAQLTARQREILAFVNEHSAQHGYPPTVREIGTAVGLTSSSTVHAHLANLERLGLLRRDPAKPRALNLVGREHSKAPAASETAGIRMLPLLGQIAAGAPLLAEGQVEELLPVPELLTASGENFLLRVRGESMIDDGIHDGDYVVVRRQDTARERRDRRGARRRRRGHRQADLPRGRSYPAAARKCLDGTDLRRRRRCAGPHRGRLPEDPLASDVRPGTPTPETLAARDRRRARAGARHAGARRARSAGRCLVCGGADAGSPRTRACAAPRACDCESVLEAPLPTRLRLVARHE